MESSLVPIAAMISIVGLIWIYFIIPTQMAEDRNRSPAVWVLISILFSPILAILLLYALGDNPEPREERRRL